MVKNSRLAKSINDVAWLTFRQRLEYFGFKYGKATVAVPPHNTSQNCSNCGQKVPKSLSTRTHIFRFFRTYTVENSSSSLSGKQGSKVDKYQLNKNSKLYCISFTSINC